MDSNQMPTAAGERFMTATIERCRDARHDFGQLAITSDLPQEPLFIAEQFLPFAITPRTDRRSLLPELPQHTP